MNTTTNQTKKQKPKWHIMPLKAKHLSNCIRDTTNKNITYCLSLSVLDDFLNRDFSKTDKMDIEGVEAEVIVINSLKQFLKNYERDSLRNQKTSFIIKENILYEYLEINNLD